METSTTTTVVTSTNLVEDAKSITRSLLQSRQTLHSTVAQADLAAQVLSQDGILLRESLHEHQVNLKSGLQLTSVGLNKLKSAENREKRNLYLSLFFFFSVVMYIILRRTRIISLIYISINAVLWSKSLITNNISDDFKHSKSMIMIPEIINVSSENINIDITTNVKSFIRASDESIDESETIVNVESEIISSSSSIEVESISFIEKKIDDNSILQDQHSHEEL